jgi:hypothetical protein
VFLYLCFLQKPFTFKKRKASFSLAFTSFCTLKIKQRLLVSPSLTVISYR